MISYAKHAIKKANFFFCHHNYGCKDARDGKIKKKISNKHPQTVYIHTQEIIMLKKK